METLRFDLNAYDKWKPNEKHQFPAFAYFKHCCSQIKNPKMTIMIFHENILHEICSDFNQVYWGDEYNGTNALKTPEYGIGEVPLKETHGLVYDLHPIYDIICQTITLYQNEVTYWMLSETEYDKLNRFTITVQPDRDKVVFVNPTFFGADEIINFIIQKLPSGYLLSVNNTTTGSKFAITYADLDSDTGREKLRKFCKS